MKIKTDYKKVAEELAQQIARIEAKGAHITRCPRDAAEVLRGAKLRVEYSPTSNDLFMDSIGMPRNIGDLMTGVEKDIPEGYYNRAALVRLAELVIADVDEGLRPACRALASVLICCTDGFYEGDGVFENDIITGVNKALNAERVAE